MPTTPRTKFNPYCVACRRRAWAVRRRAGLSYRCPACGWCACARRLSLEALRLAGLAAARAARLSRPADCPAPWCVRCKRAMQRHGSYTARGERVWRYSCRGCGVWVFTRALGPAARQRLKQAGRERRRERRAGELLNFAASRVPAHLPADVREEAAQAIAVDLLAGGVTPEELTQRRVGRYVSAAFGLRDPYRFRSLDAPVNEDDGRTFGELLAA